MGDMGEYWRDIKEGFREMHNNPEKYFTKKQIADYKKRQERREQKYLESKKRIEEVAKELKLELKIYENNGQYSFGKILDWWTTTGTAIARKTRQEYFIGYDNPQKLKEILISLTIK